MMARIRAVIDTAEEQREAFARLRAKLGSASDEEVWKILDEREPALPDTDVGWTPELRQALENRIEAARRSPLWEGTGEEAVVMRDNAAAGKGADKAELARRPQGH